jgi:hypothetical protein
MDRTHSLSRPVTMPLAGLMVADEVAGRRNHFESLPPAMKRIEHG